MDQRKKEHLPSDCVFQQCTGEPQPLQGPNAGLPFDAGTDIVSSACADTLRLQILSEERIEWLQVEGSVALRVADRNGNRLAVVVETIIQATSAKGAGSGQSDQVGR